MKSVIAIAAACAAAFVVFARTRGKRKGGVKAGDITPSSEDISLTERLKEAGKLLDIKLVDHIIVGCCHGLFYRKNHRLSRRKR